MPSMRLNTQAPADNGNGNEWQTVGKPKPKVADHESSNGKQEVARSASPAKPKNGKHTISVSKQDPAIALPSLRDSQPGVPLDVQELGFEALAAYDAMWEKALARTTKASKTATAPTLDDFSVPVASGKAAASNKSHTNGATNGVVNTGTTPSRSKVKKAKAKAAAAAEVVSIDPPVSTQRAAPAASKGVNGRQSQATAAAPSSSSKKAAKPPTIASASAQVSTQEVSKRLAEIRTKHPKDELLQMQLACSWLSSVFTEVQYSHNESLSSMPMTHTAAQPWTAVARPLQSTIAEFVESKSGPVLSQWLAQAVEQSFSLPPPSDCPLPVLVLVAAVCRHATAALLGACTALCKIRSKLVHPSRIAMTLWLLSQANAAGPDGAAIALHVWCRLILPGVVLTPIGALPEKASKKAGKGSAAKAESVAQIEPPARERAFEFLHFEILGPKGSARREALRTAAEAGVLVGTSAVAPVVPRSAIAAMDEAMAGQTARPIGRGAAAAIGEVREDLADISAVCGDEDVVRDAVTRALAKGLADPESAASALVDQLRLHGKVAGQAWSRAHRATIADSATLLEWLADHRGALSPLLSTAHGRDTLSVTLWGITESQQGALRSTKDPAARDIAVRAQGAIDSLGSATIKSQTPVLVSLVAVLALSAGAVVYTARNMGQVAEVIEPYVGKELAAQVTEGCFQVVDVVSTAPGLAWSWWIGDL